MTGFAHAYIVSPFSPTRSSLYDVFLLVHRSTLRVAYTKSFVILLLDGNLNIVILVLQVKASTKTILILGRNKRSINSYMDS